MSTQLQPTSEKSPQPAEKEAADGCDTPPIKFKVVYNKVTYDLAMSCDTTVGAMKKRVEEITGVPAALQKVMYKGMLKDDSKSLEQAQLQDGAKLMMIGSRIKDVLSTVTVPLAKPTAPPRQTVAERNTLSDDAIHQAVLAKGKPDDVMAAHSGQEGWPIGGIRGVCGRQRQKIRLTWKADLQQLWIATRERTEKVPVESVRGVESEPIRGESGYHIMAIKLGTTNASKLWLYWVPSQYVETIKNTLLGPWQIP